ncbi:hypothetical protein H7170_03550, partial [Candidatus Gracilibacteria bacterium]|nr:hypothetical protein [Candidatus Gracilibacteria bacterium]
MFHRHPLSLVLLSILVVGQSGLCSAFAATLPVAIVSKQNYVYIQSSPTTDDAWIGTQVSPSLPTPNTSLSVPTGVSQSIDASWIGNGIKKKNITSGKPNLSAVPSIPIPSPATYSSFAIQYTTPNGTLLNNISSPNSVISYVPPVLSVFGRNGTILGQSGDYVTTLVTEGTNLYYTQARFDAAFGLKTTTNLTEGANLYFTNLRAQNALSGTLAIISTDIASATGDISTLSGNLNTLSGTVATKITLTSLSALGPLTYNNSTGVFGVNIANSTT